MNRRGCLWALAAGIAVSLLLLSFVGGFVAGRAIGTFADVAGAFGDAVAVIYVTGTIQSGEAGGGLGIDGNTYSGTVVRQLKQAQSDPSVKAVVLRVDSPGGSAEGSDEIYNALVQTRKRGKPVVASMGALAASGGYYVSAAADRILANRNTLTGSIGVITILPNMQELLSKLGVRTYVFKSGAYKDTGTGLRPLTDEEQQIWQSLIDDAYRRFVQVVAEGRGMDEARVRQLADGRLYSAQQAKDSGLIDDFGDLDDAVELAAQLGGIRGKPRLVEYRRRSLIGSLFSRVLAPQELSLERLTGLPRHRTLQYLHVEP